MLSTKTSMPCNVFARPISRPTRQRLNVQGWGKNDITMRDDIGWGANSPAQKKECPVKTGLKFALNTPCPMSLNNKKATETMRDWITGFLAKPHPDLHAPDASRPVCPFVPTALKRNSITMRIVEDANPSQESMAALLKDARDEFLRTEPTTGQAAMFKTIIIMFPNMNPQLAPALIDALQRQNKLEFVREGLMLGEFHKENNTPGLHNPEFRPLRTPIPALAIRYMVDSDILFLDDPKYTPAERVEFLTKFLSQDFNRNMEAAKNALARAKSELEASSETH